MEMTGQKADGIWSARGPHPCGIHLSDNVDNNNDGSEKDQSMKEVVELGSFCVKCSHFP